jgi:ATP-binding cassette, subfamily B, bacterial HlyB/CyaB
MKQIPAPSASLSVPAATPFAPSVDDAPPASHSSLLNALILVARHRGVDLSLMDLLRKHDLGSKEPSVENILRIAQHAGLRAASVGLEWRDLLRMGPELPVILLLRNGAAMVLSRVEARGRPFHVVVVDPMAGEDAPLMLDRERLAGGWTGEAILVKRDHRMTDEAQPFGIGLILAYLLRDRRLARDIAVSAIMMSLLAASPIIFWRLLIDRVLYYHSLDTLFVISVGMFFVILFDSAFSYLRRYLVLQVTARAEAKIDAFMFDKLLDLPMDFFEGTPTGIVSRDMNEVFKIRNFLTGQLFGTLLDACVLLVFLPIMFFFSALLTFVVLGICGLICLWIVMMLPVLRKKSGAAFVAEGVKNAFLVETLQGIRTVKTLALDARQRRGWDERVARVARLRLEEGRTANVIQTVARSMERLMTSGVFVLAVFLAVTSQDQIYVGALIAFVMLTTRVSAPLIQLAHLIQQYDEARFAVETIAALVNRPPEEGRGSTGLRASLMGRIEFRGVRFRYRQATEPALDDVTFTVNAGSFFGIMGRSGSGKTTITRLLQKLHSNYEGTIKIDGNDLRAIEIDHLRSSLGVVLQDNFLFSGTVREIISAARPNARFEQVVDVARMAGAEEFIERMPRGYDTMIQEGSSSMSGGQRQRLAIARALIGDPRILILDEATSALDAESEAIINANLLRIASDRTLIVISHRLSALVPADTILVLERGRVHDLGRHSELLDRCDIYRGLWHKQNSHLLTRPTHGETITAVTAADLVS